jgi:hypothetical protein
VLVVALALAASLLTLAVVLAKPAQAQAQTITDTDREPVSTTTPGCSELVFFEGTMLTVAHTTIDANGGFHTKLQFNVKGQGEGLDSGDKYVTHEVINDQINNSTGAFNETITGTLKIIRQGSATTTDDFHTKIVFHVTVNANGEVTTEFVKFVDEPCT